jgi:hypothetical protein
MIKPIIDGKAKSFEVTDTATDTYNKWIQERVSKSVWVDCESWYRKDKTGTNIAIFPGPLALFWWKLRKPCWDHFVSVGSERWNKERKQGVFMIWAMASLLLAASIAALFRLGTATVSV